MEELELPKVEEAVMPKVEEAVMPKVEGVVMINLEGAEVEKMRGKLLELAVRMDLKEELMVMRKGQAYVKIAQMDHSNIHCYIRMGCTLTKSLILASNLEKSYSFLFNNYN